MKKKVCTTVLQNRYLYIFCEGLEDNPPNMFAIKCLQSSRGKRNLYASD